MDTSTLLSRLADHWAAAGVRHATPPPAEAIVEFEARHEVTLPPDFRAYIETMNGAAQGRDEMTSDHTVSFWRLDEMEPATDIPGTHRLFYFADFLIDSHRYAIALSPNPREATPVFIVQDTTALQVARSFTEFLSGYIANHDGTIYGRDPTPGPAA